MRRILISFLLLTLCFAQESKKNAGITFKSNQALIDINPRPNSIIFSDGNKTVLTITKEGQVEFGKDFTPTEATKLFAIELKKMGLGCHETKIN